MAPESPSYEGLILGDTYQVGRLLAHGGMGRVHIATHLRLPVRFAVKFLEPRLTRDQLSLERFRREAEIAASLGNPHIAHVLDFNTLPDGSPYMILELLEGEDLSERLAQGSLSADEVVRLSEHLASALTEAHERGVIHRDIKPENIFLCWGCDGEPFTAKVLDFGISKLRRALGRETAAGALLGTPAYMSPEQAGGATQMVDHRSDIYSMAAVLYEALSGRRVHPGDNAYEILTHIATEDPPPLAGWPPEVDAVLRRGMARNPRDRQDSAAQLHRELQRALTGRPAASAGMAAVTGTATPAETPARVDPVARTDVALPSRHPRLAAGLSRLRRSGRLGLGLAGVVALLLIGVALSPGAPDATAARDATAAHPPQPAAHAPDHLAAPAPSGRYAPPAPSLAADAAPVLRRSPRAEPAAQRPTESRGQPIAHPRTRSNARASAPAATPRPRHRGSQPATLLFAGKEL